MAITKIKSLQIQNVTSDIQTQLDAKIDIAGYVVGELPTGLINGVNSSFTLAQTPIADTERVVINGIDLERGGSNDYTISGDTITFNTPPDSGDKIIVDYVHGATGGGGSPGSGTITVVETGTFSHPVQTGTNFASYDVVHNQGRTPDHTQMFTQYNGIFKPYADVFAIGSTIYAFAHDLDSGTTANNQRYRVYRIDNVTVTIKFKLFWFEE